MSLLWNWLGRLEEKKASCSYCERSLDQVYMLMSWADLGQRGGGGGEGGGDRGEGAVIGSWVGVAWMALVYTLPCAPRPLSTARSHHPPIYHLARPYHTTHSHIDTGRSSGKTYKYRILSLYSHSSTLKCWSRWYTSGKNRGVYQHM